MRTLVIVCLLGCHGSSGATEGTSDASSDVGADASSLAACACPIGNGTYCATSVAAYATAHECSVSVLAGHEGDVLRCTDSAWTVEGACEFGCYVAPDGTPDGCKPTSTTYHLPWQCNATYETTQGFHGDICGSNGGDHTGIQDYSWDFGIPRHKTILAIRGGTVTVAANVTGPGQACYDGCTQPFGTAAFWQCCNSCLNISNHINVAHGDGTVSTYWHLDQATVHTGEIVAAGEMLGYSGTSGCSSGPHLHLQVMGNCPTGYCQSVSVVFDEAGAPACGDRVTSKNGCN